jgi:hypothetical protein
MGNYTLLENNRYNTLILTQVSKYYLRKIYIQFEI